MNELKISPEAARDLAEIKRYIAVELKNRAAADRVVRSILKSLRILTEYAEAGMSLEAKTEYPSDLRMLSCEKHIVFYRAEGSTVYVARIINGRQDYLRILFGDEASGNPAIQP